MQQSASAREGAYKAEWNVSLHGGHSAEYCDHAKSNLQDMIEAAIARGMTLYGITEHAPRVEARFLYPEEIEMGWDIAKLAANFESYAAATRAYVDEYSGRIALLRGFETEVVPKDRYVDLMLGYRQQFNFDYMVGSVHYIDEVLFDQKTKFPEVVEIYGGLEPVALKYYDKVAEMVTTLKPDIVAHFDVVRKHAGAFGATDTPPIRRAAEAALDVIRQCGAILDVNTGGYRRGFDEPFPASWIVQLGLRMGIPFCFGDDSHSCDQVGAGTTEARDYLLRNGVHSITVLTRRENGMARKTVPLE